MNGLYENILKSLGYAVNQIGLYTVNHRLARDSVSRLNDLVFSVLEKDGRCDISLSEDNRKFIVNDVSIDIVNPLIKSASVLLERTGVNNISFKKTTNTKEISDFLSFIISNSEKLIPFENIRAYFKETGIKGIYIENATYKKIQKGQKVVSEQSGEIKIEYGDFRKIIFSENETKDERQSILQMLKSNPEEFAKLSIKAVIDSSNVSPEDREFTKLLTNSLERIGSIILKEMTEASSIKAKKNILKTFEIFEKQLLKNISAVASDREDILESLKNYREMLEFDIASFDFAKKKKDFDKITEKLKTFLTDESIREKFLKILEDKKTFENVISTVFLHPDIFKDLPIKPNQITESIISSIEVLLKDQAGISPQAVKKIKLIIDEKIRDAVKLIEKNHLELYDSAKRLKTEKEKLTTIMRGISKGIIVTDDNGNIVFVNREAEKILGTKKSNLIGKNFKSSLSQEHMAAFTKSIKHLPTGETMEILELEGTNDTKDTIQSGSAILQDENGRTIGLLSSVNDISKIKEIQKMQTEFVDNVTHELRTPLVAIKHSVNLILENSAGTVNEEQKKLLEITQRNVKRLNKLIDDLLDFSKLSAENILMDVQKQDLISVVDDSVESVYSWANSKNIDIEKRYFKQPVEILFDSEKITQAVVNLLSNAIKFTDKNGKIIISVFEAEKNGKEMLAISVKDNGKGIAKEDLKKIFEKFVQAGKISPMEVRGTGLGLAIVKKIIELHNGFIDVSSELGKGSEFTLFLPKD